MEQEKDIEVNIAKNDEPEKKTSSTDLHDTNELNLQESPETNLLQFNETGSQKSNAPSLHDNNSNKTISLENSNESNLQNANEPILIDIDEPNIQDSNEPNTEEIAAEKQQEQQPKKEQHKEEESKPNKSHIIDFEIDVKVTTSETKVDSRQYPQIEYRDFKCKHIGDNLKRPVIRPHPMLQKTEPTKFSKSAFTSKNKPRKSLVELGYHPINSVGRMEQMFKSNRDKQILKMLDQQMYPDVVVKVDNVDFNCHNILLQSYAQFFRDHYNEPVISLNDKSITPEAFETVYEWMLESIPLIPREPLMALFNAATSLGIEELIKGCWHCMDADLIHLCEDQAILLYLEGRKYNLQYVQNTILQRVSKFFLTFVACKEFLEMTCDEVCTLLSSNNIGVNCELEVLLSAARWVNFDVENRKAYIENLLGCVRFSLMPAWYLLQLQNENMQCKQLEWITLDKKLMENIRKAFMYSVTQQQFGHDSNSFQKWCLAEGIRRPTDRKWIYDKGCRYHHRFNCTHLHVITYSMFEEYLASLIAVGTDYWHCIEWSLGGKKDASCCYDDFKRTKK